MGEDIPVRYRVYAETLSPREAADDSLIAVLSKYRCDVVLAARPNHLAEIADAMKAFAGAGIRVALWPMIEDERGRWPSAKNAPAWIDYVEALLARVEREGARAGEVLFDLEPPFGSIRALTPGHFSLAPVMKMMRIDHDRIGAAALISYRETLRSRGISVSAAIVPLCVFSPLWEIPLATPAAKLDADLPSVMAYTTIYEGWSRRMFSRSDALHLLSETARASVARYGARAGISLGTVHTGAFADEPIYRSPDELHADAVVARSAGVRSLSLFDLGGLVRRGPPEKWLDSLTADEHVRVPLAASRRIRWFSRALTLR